MAVVAHYLRHSAEREVQLAYSSIGVLRLASALQPRYGENLWIEVKNGVSSMQFEDHK